MSYALDDGPVKLWWPGDPCPAEFKEAARNPNVLAWAHNEAFERTCEHLLMGPKYGFPIIPYEQRRCTMALAYAMALPGSLENVAAAVGLEVRKDMEGRRLMMKMATPKTARADGTYEWHDTPGNREKLAAYCVQDTVVERALHKRLLDLSADEQDLWCLDARINDRGVYVDLKAINAAIAVIEATQAKLDTEMMRVTGGWVKACTQVAALIEWAGLRGIDLQGLAKADVTEALDRDDLPPEVRRALELRRDAAKSSTAKLKAMRDSASSDGRVRGTMQYHGAATGRWAGRRLQPQNLPRPMMEQQDIEAVLAMIGGEA